MQVARPNTRDAYNLIHEGTLAFCEVEAAGMRIDVDYLQREQKRTQQRIHKLEERLKDEPEWKAWKRRFREKTNMDSRDQLAAVLFDSEENGGMGYKQTGEVTAKGRKKADQSALETIDSPFVRNYLKTSKLKKLLSTYINGVLSQVCEGFASPFVNLHTTITYRSSVSDFSGQNIPNRNPFLAKIIRPAFIARDGHRIAESDFSGIEVRVAACYHFDPRMLAYIRDPKSDMHRDMATEIFCCKASDVSKDMRQESKNGFVFPEFYGAWYVSVAAAIWDKIDRYGLKMPDGTPMKEHLRDHGIKERGACDGKQKPKPGTFEHHIAEIEHSFWHDRFPIYNEWRRDWFKAYQRNGYFDTLTGFRLEGVFGRKDVINYPVQGSAFHCLLRCLIKVVQWLKKNKMASLIIGQIHDSMLGDFHEDELQEVLNYIYRIMTEELPDEWKWLIVPLDVGIDVAPAGGSWYDKQEHKYDKDAGLWLPAKA